MADEDPATRWALGAHALMRMPDLTLAHEAVARVRTAEPATLTEVLHDTDDLRLARWNVGVVLRSGAGEAGWWLRLADEDAPVPGSPTGTDPHVPAAVADLVLGLARGNGLRRAATASIVRRTHVLVDPEGAELAEVRDDLVSLAVEGAEVDRFRWLVVRAGDAARSGAERDSAEVSDGARQVADAVVSLLASRGAWTDPEPWVVRALGERAAGQPDIPEPREVGPDDTAGDALLAFLTQQARKFLRQDVRVRADLPDSVHQMRVAARRLRSGLRAFELLVDKEWSDDLRAELGWIAGELGKARDAEVQLERLDEHADLLDEDDAALIHASVDPYLQTQSHGARAAALQALGSDRYLRLVDTLVDGIARPPLTSRARKPAHRVMSKHCAKVWRRLSRSVEKLTMDAPSDQWHRTRIRAKRARYAVDAAVPVLGADAKDLADALSDATDILGEHQDAHVAQLHCRELAARFDGQTGFALGLLQGQERDRELDMRREFTDDWPRISHVATRALGG